MQWQLITNAVCIEILSNVIHGFKYFMQFHNMQFLTCFEFVKGYRESKFDLFLYFPPTNSMDNYGLMKQGQS